MKEKPTEPMPQARPVIAVEYDGKLYASFQNAEGARAKSDLMQLLVPLRGTFDPHSAMADHGRREAIDDILSHAEKVHGILSRYLDAAKIYMPSNL